MEISSYKSTFITFNNKQSFTVSEMQLHTVYLKCLDELQEKVHSMNTNKSVHINICSEMSDL
jgi:hypothetical protein